MSTFTDTLVGVAPALATALGGPLAGMAVAAISKAFNLSDATQDSVKDLVQGMTPSDRIKLQELDNQFKLDLARIGITLELAQIQVNQEEARSANWFVAGGRPAVMWVGAFAFAYAGVIEPIARFTAAVGFQYTGTFPAIDTNMMLQVLGGLLGLAGMRTYEKRTGTEGNR